MLAVRLPERQRTAVFLRYYADLDYRTIADVLHGVHDKADKAKRRPRPTNKRVWASVEHSSKRVIDDAFEEAIRRDPERRRRWVVLVDGNDSRRIRS